MMRLIQRLKDRAIERFAQSDGWFALAVFTVLALPVIALLTY